MYKGVRRLVRRLSWKTTDNFEEHRMRLTHYGRNINIIFKKGDVYDMNADVIVNPAYTNCAKVSSWKGTSGMIRDRISHNKTDYSTLVYDWAKYWSNKPCQNEGTVGNDGIVRWVKNEQNRIHRFGSYQHPHYFLINAGTPHAFNNKFLYYTNSYVSVHGGERFHVAIYNCYKGIFELIYNYNLTITPVIQSVAIPPLGLQVYNTQNVNTTAHNFFEAFSKNLFFMPNLRIYIPIHNSKDKETKLFMEVLIQKLRGIGAVDVDNNDKRIYS